ncbi:MAG TPA: epoxide hydrolase [Puia sp.]|jgi:pimeloyl-ACP methyl ester carboxylesterase
MSIQPYSISISPFVIEDLRERLGRARWPDEISDSGWEYGTNMAFLKDLCTHWGHGFDWKEQEEQLNSFAHFQTRIDEVNLHFIHEKGKGADPIPLLLIHGYPDSFVRFLKLIPLLTAEGPDGLSFDVIVPSIPGFGFSDRPSQPGMNPQRIAGMFARLMTGLGYKKFISHGGDWGSVISEELALQFSDRLLGLHLTEVPYYHLFSLPSGELTSKEKEYLQAGRQWQAKEGAYALLQGTKPQTLAYAVNDSPVGLAAWIIEKFYSWSDCAGGLEKIYARDELLTNLTIYWVTQTAGSAFRIYYEQAHHPWQGGGNIKVPAAFCISAKDLVPAPREFAERFFNVQQWTQLPSGGHFAAMEQPHRLAEDLFRFAGKVVPRPVAGPMVDAG